MVVTSTKENFNYPSTDEKKDLKLGDKDWAATIRKCRQNEAVNQNCEDLMRGKSNFRSSR